jgi:SAM-dependent methyltransferase
MNYDEYIASQPPKLREKTRRFNDSGVERGRRIVSKLLNVEGKNVLDIGSGTGGISVAFAEAGAAVLAIEPNKDLYEITKERLKNYKHCDVWNFTMDSLILSPFTAVILNDVLEHADRKVFYYACESLRDGDMLWLSTPNRLSPKQILKEGHSGLFGVGLLPVRLARFYVEKVRKAMPSWDITHLYTYGELVRMLEENGMDWVLVDEYKPARHFKRAPKWFKNLVAHQFRPGFFEFIAWRVK